MVKRFSILALIGAAVGFVVWSIMGQGAVSILFGSLGGTFTCKADVEHGLREFVRMQLYCALSGAVLVPALVTLAKRLVRRTRANAETTALSPPQL